jgi:spermidine/putrescine transport system permease protein
MKNITTAREKRAGRMKILAGAYTVLVYAFLYAPIAIIILFSFNTSKRNIIFEGFTTQWYGVMFHNTALLESFGNTLIVAAFSTIIAIAIGTLTAVGMYRYKFRGRGIIDALLYIPVVIPEIVLGISLLSIFSMSQIPLGLVSLIIAHATFSIPYVVFTVRARLSGFDSSIEEAAMDLGANRLKVFFNITVPVIAPGIISGGLLAFTLSVDDIIISFFTTGPSGTTFPLKAIELVRSGISPDVYALSTLVILCTFTLITVSQAIAYRRRERQ